MSIRSKGVFVSFGGEGWQQDAVVAVVVTVNVISAVESWLDEVVGAGAHTHPPLDGLVVDY